MIHYHGTPITPETAAAVILAGRHAMVSYANPQMLELCFERPRRIIEAWRSSGKSARSIRV